MRKVFVTGASGLIGTAVCEGLLARGVTVIGTDSKPCSIAESDSFKFYEAEISDSDTIEKIMLRSKPDSLVHLACTVDNDFPEVIRQQEERASAAVDKYLFKTAVSQKFKDVIMLSTHQVYATQKTREPIRETGLEKPFTAYGKLKLNSENAFKSALKRGDTKGVIMRICPIYTKSFIENLKCKVYDEKEGCGYVFGYGDYGYTFTCVYNIVDFITTVLTRNLDVNYAGIYNICDSKPVQAKEIVEFLREQRKIGAVVQKNYNNINPAIAPKAAKTEYRFIDLTTTCSNISYDNTKAQRICTFRWKLSNTK